MEESPVNLMLNSESSIVLMMIDAWVIPAVMLELVAWGFLAERRNSERRYTTS